jgi:probable rRNA maturation factor
LSIELNLEHRQSISGLTPIEPDNWQGWFQIWTDMLIAAAEMTPEDYELTLLLTDDLEIQSLNAQYRHQDRVTDVLAFAALEAEIPVSPDNADPVYLGDIVISVPRAIAQAEERSHSAQWELAWLAAHGFLHLLGWDHPDEVSLEAMLLQQDLLLQSLHLQENFNDHVPIYTN